MTQIAGVSRETQDRLLALAELVRKWSPSINLVSRQDVSRLMERHVTDSLRLLPHLPADGRLVDLGSGAGFPGVVVAIATGRSVELVEADQRKASFLRHVGRELACPIFVHSSRIEELPPCHARTITARALAPLDTLLAYAYRHLGEGGTCLFLKGARWQAELTESEVRWAMEASAIPDPHGPGVILVIRSLRHR